MLLWRICRAAADATGETKRLSGSLLIRRLCPVNYWWLIDGRVRVWVLRRAARVPVTGQILCTATLLAERALYHFGAAGDKMNLARKQGEPANFLNDDVKIKRRACEDSPLCASALVLNLSEAATQSKSEFLEHYFLVDRITERLIVIAAAAHPTVGAAYQRRQAVFSRLLEFSARRSRD